MGMTTQNAHRQRIVPHPDRREERVRGNDEEPDVDVVHADPRLDEGHAVGEGEDADEDRDRPAPEEDPGQHVQETRRQGPEDDARQPPRERVVADVDRGGRTGW